MRYAFHVQTIVFAEVEFLAFNILGIRFRDACLSKPELQNDELKPETAKRERK